MDSPINLGPQTGRHRIFAPLSTVPSYSTSFFWLVLSIPLFHKSYPSCFPYSAVVTNIAFSLNLNRQTLKQSSNSQLTHGVKRALVCCPELTHAHSPAIKVQCVLTNQRLVSKNYTAQKAPHSFRLPGTDRMRETLALQVILLFRGESLRRWR